MSRTWRYVANVGQAWPKLRVWLNFAAGGRKSPQNAPGSTVRACSQLLSRGPAAEENLPSTFKSCLWRALFAHLLATPGARRRRTLPAFGNVRDRVGWCASRRHNPIVPLSSVPSAYGKLEPTIVTHERMGVATSVGQLGAIANWHIAYPFNRRADLAGVPPTETRRHVVDV